MDNSRSFFGVYDGYLGMLIILWSIYLFLNKNSVSVSEFMVILEFAGGEVAKFCAQFLHQQVPKQEEYSAGDVGAALRKSFLRLFAKYCLFTSSLARHDFLR